MSAIIETTPGLIVLVREAHVVNGVARWVVTDAAIAPMYAKKQVEMNLGWYSLRVFDRGWLGKRRFVMDSPLISNLPEGEGITYFNPNGEEEWVGPGSVISVSVEDRIWPHLLINVQ